MQDTEDIIKVNNFINMFADASIKNAWWGIKNILESCQLTTTGNKSKPADITGGKTVKFAGQCQHGVPIGQPCIKCGRR